MSTISNYHKQHLPILDELTRPPRAALFDYNLKNNILYIGGSDSPIDWFYSIRAVKKNDLHSGFLDAAQQLLKGVNLSQVDFIIGYSLGAAIANIIALNTGIPCIGFATPGFTYNRKLKLPNGSVNYRHARDPIWLTPYFVPQLYSIGERGVLKLKYHSLRAYAAC